MWSFIEIFSVAILLFLKLCCDNCSPIFTFLFLFYLLTRFHWLIWRINICWHTLLLCSLYVCICVCMYTCVIMFHLKSVLLIRERKDKQAMILSQLQWWTWYCIVHKIKKSKYWCIVPSQKEESTVRFPGLSVQSLHVSLRQRGFTPASSHSQNHKQSRLPAGVSVKGCLYQGVRTPPLSHCQPPPPPLPPSNNELYRWRMDRNLNIFPSFIPSVSTTYSSSGKGESVISIEKWGGTTSSGGLTHSGCTSGCLQEEGLWGNVFVLY